MCAVCLEKPPYEFTGAYQNCYVHRPSAMDERHVYIVHEILSSYPFKNVLELGSYWGASSTAFVEAINKGREMIATFCDTLPTPGLWDVVGNCKHPEQVRVTKDLSWQVLESDEKYDFVLVDAGHDLKSVQAELQRLLIRKPLCVMAHDTNATEAGYAKCEGAAMLKAVFESIGDYQCCIEDCEKREGERTERGLFFATMSYHLYEKAQKIFEKWT